MSEHDDAGRRLAGRLLLEFIANASGKSDSLIRDLPDRPSPPKPAAPTPAWWESDRFVYVSLPKCPKCASHRLQTQRSIDNGDGSRTRKTKCRDCAWNFEIGLE